jgi:hypothetical protein
MAELKRKKSKGPDFRVYVGTSFPHLVFCEIEKLAIERELAAAQVVRELFLRGLAAYHRDGLLSETFEESSSLTISERAETVDIAA